MFFKILTAKHYAAKNSQKWDEKQEHAQLKICLDPQFEIYKQFIQQKQQQKIWRVCQDFPFRKLKCVYGFFQLIVLTFTHGLRVIRQKWNPKTDT